MAKSYKTHTKTVKDESFVSAYMSRQKLKDQGYSVKTKESGGSIVPTFVTTAIKKLRR